MADLRADNLCGTGGRTAINGSVFFSNADEDYLSTGSVGGWNQLHNGLIDFTVEFWVRPGKGNHRQTIFSTGGNSSTTGIACRIMEDGATGGSNGYKVLVQYSRGASGNYLCFLGGTLTVGEWAHVALVFTTSNKQLAIYVNGVLTNSSDLDGTANGTFGSGNFSSSNSGYSLQIGREPYGTTMYLDGAFISNLRIVEGVTVYTAAFTPPTTNLEVIDGTVLLCCQDSNDPTKDAIRAITGYGNLASVGVNANLVTNGNFTAGTTGWDDSLAASETTLTSENQRLKIVASGGTGRARQEVTGLTIGNRYKFQVRHVTCNSGNCFTHLGTSDGGVEYVANLGIGDEDLHTFYFTATATSAWIQIGITIGLTGYFDDVSITLVEQPKAPKVLPPYGVDAGNTFGGAISMNSSEWMYFPTGRTEERGRGRGIIHGGYNGPSSFGYNAALSAVEIASDGVTSKFGDLFQTRYTVATAGSSTRSVFIGGGAPVSPSPFYSVNTIDFVTIATKGNAQNFGDTDEPGYFKTAVSSSTRGVFTQGRIYNPSGGTGSVDVEYITIATKGDGIQFGDLVGGGRVTLCNAAMSPTRGILAGGVASPVADPTSFVNTIEYVTMATLGNSVNFGDLKKSGGGGRSNGNCSSNTRGVFSVGTQSPADGNVLNFITIATTGDALDFGDLSGGMQMRGACSNKTRGLFAGGFVAPGSANYVNTCEKITIATTGSASDWGDTFEGEDGRGYNSGISDSHGGLS